MPTDWSQFTAVDEPKSDAIPWHEYEPIDTSFVPSESGATISEPIRQRSTIAGGPKLSLPDLGQVQSSLGEMGQQIHEFATRPAVPIPRFEVTKDSSVPGAIAKSAANLALSIPEFLETPAGAISVALAPAAPLAAAAGFTGLGAHNLAEVSAEAGSQWDKLSAPEKAAALVNIGGAGAMTALPALHGVGQVRARMNPIPDLTSISKRGTLGNVEQRNIPEGAQTQPAINREAAPNDIAATERGNEKATDAWLKGVAENNPETIANAETALLGKPEVKQTQEGNVLLANPDTAGIQVRAPIDNGANVGQETGAEGTRSPQERGRIGQSTGELGTTEPLAALLSSWETEGKTPISEVARRTVGEALQLLQDLSDPQKQARSARDLRSMLQEKIQLLPKEKATELKKAIYATLSERIPKKVSLEIPPASSEAVGKGISGAEKPALPQEQAPIEATPESAGTLKSGDIDPVMGARYDGEIMGKKMFTAMLPDGKEGTTFMVDADATPEQMRAKYQEVRERFKGDKFEPRALPDEKAATQEVAPAEEAPKPQSDYDRYQELAKSIKGKTLDEAQAIQKELETIKNRNGGMPPKPPEGGGIGGGLKAALEKNKNNEGGFVNLDGAIDFGRNVFDKVKDFAAWGSELVKRAGDWIKPHLQELWQYVRNEHPEQIAKDTGWTFKKNDAPAVNMEGMPPEMVAQFKAQFKPQWEFTDRRVGSPTEGITFYTPENATRNEVVNRMDQKVAEATGKPTGDLQYRHAGIPIPGVTTLTEGVKSLGEGIRKLADHIINPEKRDAISRYFQGHSAPKTMAASEASGNALARYASAQDAAPFIAQSMALDVLGDNAKNEPFRKRLGAVLVEDRLRAIKQKFIDAANKATSLPEKAKLTAKANKVTTLIGKEFSSNADFLNAIKDPEIAAAIERHKKSVQVEAQKFHEETGGEVSGPGLHTGAFVNLEALTDEAPLNFGTGGRGDYTKPLKRKSVFSREAQGTGKKYELDYNRLAERMIRGNYDEFTKRQMYNQLVKDGLAQILPANESAPEIGGQKAQKFPIQRKVVVANGRTIPQYENLWVRHDIASEVESAFNLGSMVKNTNLAAVGRVLNRLQLAGPTDAVWHMANILSSIAGKQGGKNILIDMARKFPGVNVIDAGVRLGFKAREVLAQNTDIIRDMAELAKIGAARPEHLESGFNSRFIKVLDKAARLIRNDMFDNLAERGVITDTSEGARREFVNQVGQYNPRLAGVYQRIFKESGLSPFIVAGRNFNRAGMKAVTLSPGYKAANMSEAIKGRVVEGLGVVATLVAVPTLFNMILTGTPNGRPGTQFGQIDTGKDDAKGNHIVVDPAQWVGLRRGMRVTGLNALINGARSHKPGSEIKQDMRNDMIGAITHPWMGPTAQFPLIAATGKNTAGFTESENTKDFGKNVKAAIQNINPVLHAFWNKNDNTLAGKGGDAMKSLTGAIGVKTAATLSPTSAIQNRAKSWGLSSENPKIKTAFEQREKEDFGESKYKPLATALRLNKPDDAANEINKILLEETTEKDRAKAKQLILKRFDPFTKVKGNIRAKVFLTPSGAMEQAYKASMNDEDRDLYKQAVRDKVAAYRALTAVMYGAPRNPPLLEQSGLR